MCSTHEFSFEPVSLRAHSFPWQMFHAPFVSDIPGYPLELIFHLHSFTHCSLGSLWMGSDPVKDCLASQDFLWNLGTSSHDPVSNSSSLHACQANTTGTEEGLVAWRVARYSWTIAQKHQERGPMQMLPYVAFLWRGHHLSNILFSVEGLLNVFSVPSMVGVYL